MKVFFATQLYTDDSLAMLLSHSLISGFFSMHALPEIYTDIILKLTNASQNVLLVPFLQQCNWLLPLEK